MSNNAIYIIRKNNTSGDSTSVTYLLKMLFIIQNLYILLLNISYCFIKKEHTSVLKMILKVSIFSVECVRSVSFAATEETKKKHMREICNWWQQWKFQYVRVCSENGDPNYYNGFGFFSRNRCKKYSGVYTRDYNPSITRFLSLLPTGTYLPTYLLVLKWTM